MLRSRGAEMDGRQYVVRNISTAQKPPERVGIHSVTVITVASYFECPMVK